MTNAHKPYERVMVPLDGSEYAEQILPHAEGLAEALGARLKLLRIAFEAKDRPEAEEYVESLAVPRGAAWRVVDLEHDPLGEDDIADTIHAIARRFPSTLVAMTTHGRNGLGETLLGSVAMDTVRKSKDPVVLFRPREESGKPEPNRRIDGLVAALDGTDFPERMLPHLVDLSGELDVKLRLIHSVPRMLSMGPGSAVIDPVTMPPVMIRETAYLETVADDLRETFGIEPTWEVLHGEPAGTLAEFARRRPHELLAVATHSRKGLDRLIFGGVTAACLRKAGVPILVYPAASMPAWRHGDAPRLERERIT